MKTGGIEICVNDFKILNEAKTQLPFIPRDFQKVSTKLMYSSTDMTSKTSYNIH